MQMTDSQVTMEKTLLLTEHLKISVCLLIVNAFQSNELFCLEAGVPRKAEVEEVHMSLPPSLGGIVSLRQNSFSASAVVSQNVF